MNQTHLDLLSLHMVNGVEESTHICQYMDLDYFLQLLENKEYCVKRKFTFEDANEGMFPLKSVFPLSAVGATIPPQPKQDIDICLRVWKKIQELKVIPTACWTLNTQERLSMWKTFTNKFGVCVKSSVHNVVASIMQKDYDIWCGKIEYNGYYAQKGLISNLFSKKPVFSEEDECRFYFFGEKDMVDQSQYVKLKIDPNIMVNDIVLSPFINRKSSQRLASFFISEYGIHTSPSTIKI